jgi:hypothetical protein
MRTAEPVKFEFVAENKATLFALVPLDAVTEAYKALS